jgi:hypothetical protein
MMRPEGRPPEGRGPMMRPPAAPQGPAAAPGALMPPQSRLFEFRGGRVEIEAELGEGAGRLMRLIGPEARERLGLSDQQVEKIRGILSEIRQGAGQMAERMRGAMKDVPPQERAERMREMVQNSAAERARRMRKAEETVMGILSPEQREKFERWLRERGPEAGRPSAPSERPRPETPPPGRMRSRPGDSPAAAPPPAAPAVQREPAQFHFVQWNTAGANGVGAAANVEQARAAMAVGFLDDPDIRSGLNLSNEQKAKIAALQDRSKKLIQRIQDDAKLQFGQDDPSKKMSEDEQRARAGEMARAMAERFRAAQPQLDAITKETFELLTMEQQAKLQELIQERLRLMSVGGGLWVLGTEKARGELGLSAEVVGKVRKILAEAADENEAVRKELAAAMKDAPAQQRAETMRARWQEYGQKMQERQTKVRDAVFVLLTADQKPKAEKFIAEGSRPQPWGNGVFPPGMGIQRIKPIAPSPAPPGARTPI